MNYNILIHRYLSGSITADENQQLDQWLSRDPMNRKEFEEIKVIWENSEENDEEVTDAEFQEEFQKLNRSIEESATTRQQIRRHRTSGTYKNLLLISLVLVIFSLFTWVKMREGPRTTVRASNSENQELILTDNSRVLLNDSSSISFAMSPGQRELNLNGEALFDVSDDKNRPFVITARDVKITVLGTSFVVKCYAGKPVEVTAISGSVEVEYQNSKTNVSPGEKSVIDPDHGISKFENDDPNFSSWYTGELVFEKSELKDVLRMIGKHYNVRFNVTDPDILKCRFTGRFNNSKLADVLKILSFSLHVKFSFLTENNIYEVSGKGCI